MSRFPPEQPEVRAALARLEEQGWGPSSEYEALARLSEGLEQRSLEAEDAHERGRLATAEMMEAFVAARVAMAVLGALEGDPAQAAENAVYEAWIALQDEPDELVAAVEAALGGPASGGASPAPRADAAPASDWLPGVAGAVKEGDEQLQRRVAEAVVAALLERVPMEHRTVARALKALRKESYGETRARRSLLSHVDDLHREAERLERAGAGEEARAASTRANAVSAIWSALDADPEDAAVGALAPAWGILEDDPAITRRLAELGLVRPDA